IQSPYLINKANFVACHNFSFMEKYDVLSVAEPNAVFLLASPYSKDEVWDHLPIEVQKTIIDKKLKFYVIDAYQVAEETGLGSRINIIMQTAFFVISNIIPAEKAVNAIKDAVKKTYGKKGEKVVAMNIAVIDKALKKIEQVIITKDATSKLTIKSIVSDFAPDFVKEVTSQIVAGKGDKLSVSDFPIDGTYPVGTTQFEKRNIALNIPEWNSEICIQCGQCSIVCPHAVIRMKIYDKDLLKNAPQGFKHSQAKGKNLENKAFTLQVAPEDCTGCGACVNFCPIEKKDENKKSTGEKAINMISQVFVREKEKKNFDFFLSLPDIKIEELPVGIGTVKGSQLMRPLFEFSGACPGCGETPYVKLVTQLYGDRALIANATGCSSIYGGNLPTTPYCSNKNGKGPAWSNSLFEDNAEFGFGMRLSIDQISEQAGHLIKQLTQKEDYQKYSKLFQDIIDAPQKTHQDIEAQRQRVDELKQILSKDNTDNLIVKNLMDKIDYLVSKSVWIFGGDGWA
ncbi:MAG: 2-oxoacid:acceptor oxidoreductase family protein, partial [Candidatus Omnitrophica bacterium]|nr:2-oxoacid:acceptor oxidoreductase family protein [Candidatus Omnitrophota bacterium]